MSQWLGTSLSQQPPNPLSQLTSDPLSQLTISQQGVSQEPVAATQGPLSATQKSLAVTQEPLSATPKSLAVTQEPLSATPQSLVATQEPLATTQEPLATTQEPLATTQESLAATQESLFSNPITNSTQDTVKLTVDVYCNNHSPDLFQSSSVRSDSIDQTKPVSEEQSDPLPHIEKEHDHSQCSSLHCLRYYFTKK